MSQNRKNNILLAVAAFEKQLSADNEYILFLKRLNDEEKECLFYFDAQRSAVFLDELIFTVLGKHITPDDLDDNIISIVKQSKILKNDSAITAFMEFWSMFGKIPRPSIELKQRVIQKHNLYFKQLMKNEIDFFLNS